MTRALKNILLTKTLLVVCLLQLSTAALHAQGRFFYSSGIYEPELLLEAGISLGMMNGVTDIQGNPQVYQGPFAGITLRNSNIAAGIYGIVTWRDLFAARLELTVGAIEGYDSLLKNATAPSAIGRYERNLNFRSPIREVALMGEFHFVEPFRSYEKEPLVLSPYVLGGFSWFSFYPQAYTANGWVDLPPLRLEGQGFAEYPDRPIYKTNTFSYPIGIGFRYDVSSKFTMRFEFVKRTSFTDYLDDAHEPNWVDPNLFDNYLAPDQAALAKQLYNRSTTINPPRNTRPRGNPAENDAFWTATIKIGINLNRDSNGGLFGGESRKSSMKKLRCPNF
jgi:Domain of unknown function (DUF6089)